MAQPLFKKKGKRGAANLDPEDVAFLVNFLSVLESDVSLDVVEKVWSASYYVSMRTAAWKSYLAFLDNPANSASRMRKKHVTSANARIIDKLGLTAIIQGVQG